MPDSEELVFKWYGLYFQVAVPPGFKIRENRTSLTRHIAGRQVRYINASTTPEGRAVAKRGTDQDMLIKIRDYSRQLIFGSPADGQQTVSRIWDGAAPLGTSQIRINSSSSGYVEGLLLSIGFKFPPRIPSAVQDPTEYVRTNEMYIGNSQVLGDDISDVIAGMCGTPAILKGSNELVGFIRYIDNEVVALTDARDLTEKGYRLTSML